MTDKATKRYRHPRGQIDKKTRALLSRTFDQDGRDVTLESTDPESGITSTEELPAELIALIRGATDEERAESRAALIAAFEVPTTPTAPTRPLPDNSQGARGGVVGMTPRTTNDKILARIRQANFNGRQ